MFLHCLEQGEATEERSDFMKSRIHVILLGEITKRPKLQIRKGKNWSLKVLIQKKAGKKGVGAHKK